MWSLKGNAVNTYRQPFEHEPEFNLSLPPGLYVMNVFAKWEGKGDVSYGFLVLVNDPQAKIKNNDGPLKKTGRTYALGDLILGHEDKLYLWEKEVEMVSRGCGENRTLLKEGYLFLFDNVTGIFINNSVSNISNMTTPVLITPFATIPVTGMTEKISGFEVVLSITIILALNITRKRRW